MRASDTVGGIRDVWAGMDNAQKRLVLQWAGLSHLVIGALAGLAVGLAIPYRGSGMALLFVPGLVMFAACQLLRLRYR